ncbi:MAG: NUDIX domain-containing protein [Deltaproteobacteria bacterium]
MEREYKNPLLTVDIIIELGDEGIVLIQRKNPPYGWAIPGGFVDYGETLEEAAAREALEETSLVVSLRCQMRAYSDPERDHRFHTVSMVFVARAHGVPEARDDAKGIGVFTQKNLPSALAFDHERILGDYFRWKKKGFEAFGL